LNMLENKKEVKLDYSVTQDDIDRAHELIEKYNWKNVKTDTDKRKLNNLRRRVNRARDFPKNTTPAERHLHTMAESLATTGNYPMLYDEPEYCAESMLAVLEELWKTRKRMVL